MLCQSFGTGLSLYVHHPRVSVTSVVGEILIFPCSVFGFALFNLNWFLLAFFYLRSMDPYAVYDANVYLIRMKDKWELDDVYALGYKGGTGVSYNMFRNIAEKGTKNG